jgi:Pyridine nucleotide-disulphide oxidoreductase
VLTLHSLQDYMDLQRRLPGVGSAVVIGGGAHAIETVMCLLQYGIEVQWLIRSETFMPRMLDSTSSSIVLENVRNAGAKITLKTEVIGVVGRVGSVVGVITNDNNMIPCQLVLVCTGTSPVTTLAKRCTIPMMHDCGILVDQQFRTSVRDIYAAGDVAARKNPQTGVYETQAQWYAAVLQGRSAAAVMTGHHELAAQSMGVPWHATHLGDMFMLTVGNPLHRFEGATICTDRSKKKYCRMSIVGDRLVGYLSIGSAQPDSLAIKSIIDEGLSVRRIKKDLLKGNFDARKYFSEWRSQEAMEMVTSGKIPVVKPVYYPVTPVRSFPAVTHPAAIAATQRSAIEYSPTVPGSILSAGAKIESRHPAPTQKPKVFSVLADQPTIHTWRKDEDERPSTGKLSVPSTKEIESILLSLPSRSVARGLLSYSEKRLAVKAPGPSIQQQGHRQLEKTNFLL